MSDDVDTCGHPLHFDSVLIHNVDQSDLLFAIESPNSAAPLIGRPKFNRYSRITSKVLAAIQSGAVQLTQRKYGDVLYGFDLSAGVPFPSFDAFKLRSDYAANVRTGAPLIVAVYFPHLAVILPKWRTVSDERRERALAVLSQLPTADTTADTNSTPRHRRTIFIVSGSAVPGDQSADGTKNSTKSAAKLCELFIRSLYDDAITTPIHSRTDVTRFDANITFIHTQLRPHIDGIRRSLAERFREHWNAHIAVTTSLTDGAPARISAIQTSLRSYKPDCIHLCQLNAFWYDFPAITNRAYRECYFIDFDKLEMTPPVRVADTDATVSALVDQLRQYQREFENIRDSRQQHNELQSFWLRKSRQPVLSVLLVKKSEADAPRYYRGVNLEVSLPTGSLCSERSAIAAALSADSSLCRSDMKMIAVLALPIQSKQTATLSIHHAVTDGETPKRKRSTASPTHIRIEPLGLSSPVQAAKKRKSESEDDGAAAVTRSRSHSLPGNAANDLERIPSSPSPTTSPQLTALPTPVDAATQAALDAELDLMRVRKQLASGDDGGRNPISPCGACNEWLKKIAEVNPDFRIVTFTATDTATIFVKAVKF